MNNILKKRRKAFEANGFKISRTSKEYIECK